MKKTEYVVYTEDFQIGKYSPMRFFSNRNYGEDEILNEVLGDPNRDSMEEVGRFSTLSEAEKAFEQADVSSYERGGTLWGNIAYIEQETLELCDDEWEAVDWDMCGSKAEAYIGEPDEEDEE